MAHLKAAPSFLPSVRTGGLVAWASFGRSINKIHHHDFASCVYVTPRKVNISFSNVTLSKSFTEIIIKKILIFININFLKMHEKFHTWYQFFLYDVYK